MILKKISAIAASVCRKKKIACSKNVIESLWEKRGKKYPANQIARKKELLMTRNQPPPPPPSQELNGRPLSEERKIAQKVKFARIAYD